MDTASIKNFSISARSELCAAVAQQAYYWHIAEDWMGHPGNREDELLALDGRPLTEAERTWRTELLRRIDAVGYERFIEEMAYTWFDRFVAIRYMEVHGFLPSRTCIFSAGDSPEALAVPESLALKEALSLDLPGLDRARLLDLVQQGDDEELFRAILLAECNELAACVPAVFGRLGGADALMLPRNLRSEGSLISRMVTDIPVGDWRDVEILGWMYQFYITERKDGAFAGFKKKRKATAETLPVATQLFTPHWIVRYMVENSLGRLWMLNNPASPLRERMDYYIEPEGEVEDFIRVAGPEDIAFCDPACGSAHILVYAFDLLVEMYRERGYVDRDIPELILTKNLKGFEIDSRAADFAVIALMCKARELDRRFFRRGVRPDVTVLSAVPFTEDELALVPALAPRKRLIDALAHLDEVGSLLVPAPEDIAALAEAAAQVADGGLFAEAARGKVERALGFCRELARTYDVVVANPPYMGSSNFNPWLSAWIKKTYPDEKSDLFSAFVKRISILACPAGEIGMMTPYVWMFIGSYEKLRTYLIEQKTITSLVQLEYSGFAGATVPICTFTFTNAHVLGLLGGYVRLSDFVGADNQAPKALEAIRNPDCGWFYRADADSFNSIPGTPIAYWASRATLDAFVRGTSLAKACTIHSGVRTGNNDSFLRFWWEVSGCKMCVDADSVDAAQASGAKWFPCNKGGGFRKWFGNNAVVINWENDGFEIRHCPGSDISPTRKFSWPFRGGLTWGTISSSRFSMRRSPKGFMFETKGAALLPVSVEQEKGLLAFLNSSVVDGMQRILSPTLDYHEGPLGKLPVLQENGVFDIDSTLVDDCVDDSKTDYDSLETSWDFKRHPLV